MTKFTVGDIIYGKAHNSWCGVMKGTVTTMDDKFYHCDGMYGGTFKILKEKAKKARYSDQPT